MLIFRDRKRQKKFQNKIQTSIFSPQEVDDGLLEVVAIDNLDLAILHAGGSGASVCQCKTAVVTTKAPVPMQVTIVKTIRD